MLNNSTILITGGTGSFGNAVLKRFLDSEINEIRILSRDEKKQDDLRKKYNHSKLKFYIGDVRDPQSFESTFDIVNCTEVGEHIDPQYAATLMENLIRLSNKYIVLTWSKEWAPKDAPHQHLNPMEYNKFVEFATSFGLKKNDLLTQRFKSLLQSPYAEPAFFWWAESITVFEK